MVMITLPPDGAGVSVMNVCGVEGDRAVTWTDNSARHASSNGRSKSERDFAGTVPRK
jgi:hypothetical protein